MTAARQPLELVSSVLRSAAPAVTDTATLHTLSSSGFLRLLQLSSPALPIGAFAYSQGLEAAAELGLIRDEASAQEFLCGILTDGLTQLELPILSRLHAAFSAADGAAAEHWSAFLLASRETRERREEEQHLGRALARLLADQGLEQARGWQRHELVTHATLFALAGAHFGVAAEPLLLAYAFSWAENQVGALCRLLPMGQLAAQRVLAVLGGMIPTTCATARELPDTELGATLPALALLSALHETQYTRLFKS